MHEAVSALKSSVTGASSHSKTVSRTEKISKRPRGQDNTAVRAPAFPPPQEFTPDPPAPPPQEVRAAAPAKSSNSKPSKPWPDPDPDIAFTPDKNFKGCWWCHRRHLPVDQDHLACPLRKKAAQYYQDMLKKGKPHPKDTGAPPRD